MRPSLSPRDTSTVTISEGKGSDNVPNASVSRTSGPQPSGGNGHVFPLALFISCLLSRSFLSCLDILQYMGSGFGKLVGS